MAVLKRVVAGIIVQNNRVLATKRKPGGPAGSSWEFPGGKVLAEESDEDALVREIREELSIEIDIVRPYHKNLHRYPGINILLISLLAVLHAGIPSLHVHEEYRWCGREDLSNLNFAPADLPVLGRLLDEWPLPTD